MDTSNLMEQILSSDNLNRAYLQVVRNKGAEGVDGMKYTELKEHLAKNGETIKGQLRTRKYKPQPVRRVEIPKPDGGVRNLGVPTVTDRFIQQAIAQALTPIYEEQFHDHSYGFRPNRCAQQAILTALDIMNDGNDWIVDIDLEKFFDTVNHDKLMTLIGRMLLYRALFRNTISRIKNVFPYDVGALTSKRRGERLWNKSTTSIWDLSNVFFSLTRERYRFFMA